jgi:hypothetical protein
MILSLLGVVICWALFPLLTMTYKPNERELLKIEKGTDP